MTTAQTLNIDQCDSVEEASEIIRRSRTPCSFFSNGSCKFGSRCSFYHAPVENHSVNSGATTCDADLSIGNRVEIIGLKSALELNNRRGKIISFVQSSQRFAVVLDGEKDSKAIKSNNLLKIHS